MRGLAILLLVGSLMFTAGAWAADALPWPVDFGISLALLAGAGTALVGGRRNRQLRDPHRAEVDGWREVARELERSRRHERPFAVIRVLAASEPAETVESSSDETASRLARELRQGDTVWSSSDAVWVLMPESGRTQANEALTRVARAIPQPVLGDASSVASFPEDAVTAAALRQLLEAPRQTPVSERLAPPIESTLTHGG